jgi:hypothetical protein
MTLYSPNGKSYSKISLQNELQIYFGKCGYIIISHMLTCMHTHKHTRSYMRMCARMHAHTLARRHTQTECPNICKHAHACTCTITYAKTHAHMHTRLLTCIQMYTPIMTASDPDITFYNRKCVSVWKRLCHKRKLKRMLADTEPQRQLALQRGNTYLDVLMYKGICYNV